MKTLAEVKGLLNKAVRLDLIDIWWSEADKGYLLMVNREGTGWGCSYYDDVAEELLNDEEGQKIIEEKCNEVSEIAKKMIKGDLEAPLEIKLARRVKNEV